MTMSCKQASFLVSKSLDTKLHLWEKVSLYFHLSMCSACRGNSHQLKQIHEVVKTNLKFESMGKAGLSEKSRERIRKTLQNI